MRSNNTVVSNTKVTTAPVQRLQKVSKQFQYRNRSETCVVLWQFPFNLLGLTLTSSSVYICFFFLKKYLFLNIIILTIASSSQPMQGYEVGIIIIISSSTVVGISIRKGSGSLPNLEKV